MSKHIDTGHGLAVSDITDDQLRNAAEYSCYASQTDVVQMARDLAAEVLRLRTAAPGMAWVSTAERLPGGDSWVLGYFANGEPLQRGTSHVHFVRFDGLDDDGAEVWFRRDAACRLYQRPSHWAPLPPAPETGEGR